MSKDRAMVRQGACLLAGLCGAALLGGYLGAIWPFGDSLAVGRIPAALTLGAAGTLLLIYRARRRALLCNLVAVLALASTWAPALAPGPGAPIVLYQKNQLYRGLAPAALAQDIRRHSADIVAVQEIRRNDTALRDLLRNTYPTQAWCPFSGVGGTAVLSRWPRLSPAICLKGATALQVQSPHGPLWVVSVHLQWPAPKGQRAHADRLAEALATLQAPIILAGDFNMVAWGYSARLLRRATQTRRYGGPIGTLPLARYAGLGESPWPALPIDHVFAPQGWGITTTRRPRLTSDHFGLVATIGPP